MRNLASLYIGAALPLDPLFSSVRAKHYDPAGQWVRPAAEGTPVLALQRTGGFLNPACLVPAFGWDARPWTRPTADVRGRMRSLLEALGERRDWDLCRLNYLSDEEVAALRSEGAGRVVESPILVRVIAAPRNYAEYLATRSSSTNKNQRNFLNRVAKRGMEFRREVPWRDLERLMQVQQAATAQGRDYTKEPTHQAFMRDYTEELRKAGRLEMLGLYLGDRLVSYQVGVRSDDVIHLFQTGFDPEFSGDRVGAVVVEKFVENAYAGGEPPGMLDLMNDAPYMGSLAKEVISLKSVLFYSKGFKGRVLGAVGRLRRG
jgi:hypothetical protein